MHVVLILIINIPDTRLVFPFFHLVAISDVNIALNKTASQPYTYQTSSADKAVDGCTSRANDTDVAQCCSATLPPGTVTDNYFQLNLGWVFTIGKILVFGRTDGKPGKCPT